MVTAQTPQTSDSAKRLRRALVGGFCVYHMAASFFANMPPTTAFGGELRAPFDAYIAYAGLKQSWTMFDTIPYFRSVHPTLVERYPSGREVDVGPMLPGLERYRHRTRLTALFVRFTWPNGDLEPFVRGYLQRACAVAVQSIPTGAERPSAIGLRLDSERLLPLAEVRRTGSMSSRAHEFSPITAPCE
jgi:hypothetical protein